MGKVDFFAVLPTGFYILIVGVIVCISNSETQSFWEPLNIFIEEIDKNPSLLILVFFAAYLAGSIIRALKVRWVEYFIPPFRITFPNNETIAKVLAELKGNAAVASLKTDKLPAIDKPVTTVVFNYWKDVLCVNNPVAFDYYESYEARARFFAGMFWAGVLGVFGAIVLAIRMGGIDQGTTWFLFTVSAIILLTFGSQFRSVRDQEVTVLLSIYVAYHQGPKNEQ